MKCKKMANNNHQQMYPSSIIKNFGVSENLSEKIIRISNNSINEDQTLL